MCTHDLTDMYALALGPVTLILISQITHAHATAIKGTV